ncbi:Adenine-specific DNA methylase containing a Zn-ribbon [Synechococcus sp. WH 8101]|uniref:DUF1156 domain-containing protein n=1 Tax=Synechococcus sp. WH 8101 TaxID=59932 RepID=UPI001022D2BD|nr:DUF1156 domain-containing protein [Synechococcus sp. WH 8101]QBE68630.1 Adenine-specific DNA methylase containing a Zn-ribbon [Synechococcus sp. WH 8101]QNI44852.1 D12 class N6 adenine-specific DNA methyltransferase family protein [Synechococcus sp. WH 8101]
MTDHSVKRRKKLIEVAIPLEAINAACAHDKAIRRGHPRNIHYWFAPRPLAAAKAAIYCQCVDDPSSIPEDFPTPEQQEVERIRLFRVLCQALDWTNRSNKKFLDEARLEIKKSWTRCCNDNKDHPDAVNLFDPKRLPPFHDAFAGGGAIPLEAQALGFEVLASDLNPVAVLINKALIEVPPKYAKTLSVHPRLDDSELISVGENANGLCEDIVHYGRVLLGRAIDRIGSHYQPVKITADIVDSRPDLSKYLDQNLQCIAWIWARTVSSPDPSYSDCEVPLASTFILTSNSQSESWIEPIVSGNKYRLNVIKGRPPAAYKWRSGTKVNGANFKCLLSGAPITAKYIREEARKGRLGSQMIAIVLQGNKERVYITPTVDQLRLAQIEQPPWKPNTAFLQDALGFRVGNYGMSSWGDLYTNRQALALTTLCDELGALDLLVSSDIDKGIRLGRLSISDWSQEKKDSYIKAIRLYLSIAVSKTSNRSSSLCTFKSGVQCPGDVFSRQTLSMTWDFCEANILSGPSGSFESMVDTVVSGLRSVATSSEYKGVAFLEDAAQQKAGAARVVSIDPPYFDNIGYADLSDYFYVWLRRAIKADYPLLFGTIETPKHEELVATPARHGGKKGATEFFLDGMKKAVMAIAANSHPAYPMTIYYAFKQSETSSSSQSFSTGWEAFLDALVSTGLVITAAWPVSTERENRKRNQESNALSSSIVLSCRKRSANSSALSRSAFKRSLRNELQTFIAEFSKALISPADMAQAAIGPGMAIFSSANGVLNPDDSRMSVRDALIEINAALDECLSQGDGELDADSRFALTFFESFGYSERDFGDAEGLAKARNVSVEGVAKAGILRSVAGKAWLLRRDQLAYDWDPSCDERLCVWEATQHLIKRLEAGGEGAAAELLGQLKKVSGHGDLAANCRALAYRLYNHCEKTKQAEEARAYNGLVIAWPELERLAASQSTETTVQASLI